MPKCFEAWLLSLIVQQLKTYNQPRKGGVEMLMTVVKTCIPARPHMTGIEFGGRVFVPVSFDEVKILSTDDFLPNGMMADVLDTFPRDLDFMEKTGNDRTFRHYGSTLAWAIKNAKPS